MVASVSNNEHWVRYWAFVSAWQTSLNIGKLYLSLVQNQAAVPGGRISNSTTSPSATVIRHAGRQLLQLWTFDLKLFDKLRREDLSQSPLRLDRHQSTLVLVFIFCSFFFISFGWTFAQICLRDWPQYLIETLKATQPYFTAWNITNRTFETPLLLKIVLLFAARLTILILTPNFLSGFSFWQVFYFQIFL